VFFNADLLAVIATQGGRRGRSAFPTRAFPTLAAQVYRRHLRNYVECLSTKHTEPLPPPHRSPK